MRNFKLVLTYDGSRYRGWQRLGGGENTIQAKLEHVASRMLDKETEVIGSGRTDAGVHALGQVANFHGETSLTPEEILAYLRRYLPEDIGVLSVEEVPDRFHSRLSAVEKTYEYRIWNDPAPCVFQRKYVWRMEEPLDLSAMKRAAKDLVGEHDFTSFCGNRQFKKSPVRTVSAIEITRRGGEVVLRFTGSGFLHHMVRILTGTLVEAGLHRRDAGQMPAVLAARDRQAAGITAPPCGLCLVEVRYG